MKTYRVETRKLVNAFVKTANRMRKPGSNLLAASTSAGVFFPVGVKQKQKRGQRTGIQVFVQVFHYDEAVKRCLPHTGGLLAYVAKNISRA